MLAPQIKFLVGAAFGLLAACSAFPQQVGVLSLPLRTSTVAAEKQEPTLLPAGCSQPTGVLANGVVRPPDNVPRPILLEIVKLSGDTFEVGGQGRAEIRLKNTGDKPVTIPWSTDSRVHQGENPDVLQWEQANLSLVLMDSTNRRIALTTPDWPLYGSSVVKGSLLTIQSGKWVTAFLDFKMEDQFHIVSPAEFPVGESRLFLEWGQASRSWTREKCGWSRIWFDYGMGKYYKQEHPTILVQITKSKLSTAPK